MPVCGALEWEQALPRSHNPSSCHSKYLCLATICPVCADYLIHIKSTWVSGWLVLRLRQVPHIRPMSLRKNKKIVTYVTSDQNVWRLLDTAHSASTSIIVSTVGYFEFSCPNVA